MTRIGITGHRGLPPPTARLVAQALRDALTDYSSSITGVTALADGADQLFARAVLDHGGQIEVIVPATEYRAGLPRETHPDYDDLLSHATTVHRLEFTESSAESHMAASTLMITMISELFAVWDHQPARGYAGTADVIAHARQHGLPIRIIWPEGATRETSDETQPGSYEPPDATIELRTGPGRPTHQCDS